ncbi:MAG: nucleotidyltransferase [Deltaproteobacteria bacterium]|nr:nucleotidyltransferase [Deltaproteobacteria bacterium]
MAVLKVEDLLKELNRFGVEFIIIGGMAAVAQGSAYLTMDLDLCYSRSKENIEKLADALAPFQPSLRGAPPDLPFRLDVATIRSGMNFTLSTNFGDLDILGEVTGLTGYPEALLFSEVVELYGMRCRVLTLEGLIKTKKAAGRPKDLMILPELEALLEIRRTQNKS